MSMIPTLLDKRPPHVRFEDREYGINQEASATAGRPVPRIVTMACITPPGTKDEHVKIAEDWLPQLKRKALNGEYPVEWYNFIDMQYSEYKKGNELPREGTPIQTWAAINNTQRATLKALQITTVEDLAEYPDSGLGNLGLDGRYVRDLARAWMNEGKDKGINAKALADANARIAAQEETIASLNARLAVLEEGKRGPGRPRKTEAA